MRLSRTNAEKIVKELNTVIDQSVNMMNEEGIIIASTDQERVGQIHEGARKIIEQNLEELVIRPEDVYEGSLEGVNYSIMIGGEVIGVVGITGPVQEVAKYGQITRKMTEILMQELSIKEQKDMDENLRNRFLSEWLLSDTVMINKNFVDRGKRMHLDITLPRRIMVIAVHVSECYSDSLDEMRSVESAENRIKNLLKRLDKDSVYLKSSSCLICGVANRADRELEHLAENLKEAAEKQPGVRLAIGIDDRCRLYTMTHISYTKAYKALQACMRAHGKDIRFYNEINLEIFTDEISDLSKKEYVQKLFPGYRHEELAEVIGVLEVLYETEGSITAASEALHMHKNTLQYKLKRIYERTGYDPRSLRYSALFLIAIDFYREIRGLLYEE